MSSDIKGFWNLYIGDDTSISKGCTFYCTIASLTIGKKVIFGPHPTIITGDYRIDIIGKYIIDVKDDENGMIAKVKDADSIVKAIISIDEDRGLLSRMSENARYTIFTRLKPEDYVEKWNKIYSL